MPSRSIHVVTSGKILFCFYGWVIFWRVCVCVCVCVCVPYLVYFLQWEYLQLAFTYWFWQAAVEGKITLIIIAAIYWAHGMCAVNPGTGFLFFFSSSYWWDRQLRVVKKSAHDLTGEGWGVRTCSQDVWYLSLSFTLHCYMVTLGFPGFHFGHALLFFFSFLFGCPTWLAGS